MRWIDIAKPDEIKRGACKVVRARGRSVAVFNVDGEYCAIDNTCPHQGGPLGEGELEGGAVVCPWHGWKYDVRSGRAMATPAVETFKVRVENDAVKLGVSASGRLHEAEPTDPADEVAALDDPIHHVLRRIEEGRTLDQVFHNIYAGLQEVVPHDRLGLALIDGDSGRLVQVKTASKRPIRLNDGFSAQIAGTSLERILRSGEPRILDDLEAHHARRPSAWTRLILEEGMRSSLTLPLKLRGEPIGVVFFTSVEANAFDESHVGCLLQIAGHLSVLIEKGRWVGELAQNQERYRLLLESGNDAIFACAALDRPFFTFNDNLCEWLGRPYRELSQLSLIDLFPDTERERVERRVAQLREDSLPVTFRAAFETADGGRLPVELRLVTARRQGEPVIYGFAHDLSEIAALREELDRREEFPNLIGKSRRMREIFSLVRQVAPMPTTVLITGESGVGKEPIARAIHANSSRAGKPFVAVNCAALSESLLESELFGHERGAFTGATATRKGRFEASDGGSIFLDEIGELSPSMQTKLLRVLQEGEFERVGSSFTTKVDARVIAATNRDLKAAMEQGWFRQDLYYRLNVVPIRVPPLRERRDDIPPLIRHFIERFRKTTGKEIDGIDPAALDILTEHPYPGNVRELENLIEHAFVKCSGPRIEPRHLPDELVSSSGDLLARALAAENPLAALESELVRRVLDECDGNRQLAAQRLGISRTTLWRKLRRE